MRAESADSDQAQESGLGLEWLLVEKESPFGYQEEVGVYCAPENIYVQQNLKNLEELSSLRL